MIKFRQKIFFAPILGSLLTNGVVSAGVGAGGQVVAAKQQAKAQEESDKTQERIARQQNLQAQKDRKLQEQQNQIQNKLQKQQMEMANKQFKQQVRVAKKTGVNVQPTITSGQLQQPQETTYSEKTKEATGFIKNIGTLAKERNLHGALAGAVVGGAIAGGGSYLVDKAIQRDIRKGKNFRLAKPELTPEEKAAQKKKRNRQLLAKVGTGAALVGGAVAAKKGLLGTNTQNVANKYINRNTARGVGNTFKTATKDYFTHVDPETGTRKVNKLSLALTGVGLASPILRYRSAKKQYEEQVRQSEGTNPQERNYSKNPIGGINFQKIGKQISGAIKPTGTRTVPRVTTPKTTTTAGGRVNFQKIGKQIRSNFGGKTTTSTKGQPVSYKGNPYESASRTVRFRSQLKRKAEPIKKSWGEFKKHPGESILGGISSMAGGGGRSGVSRFGDDLRELGEKTGNQTSQKVGTFIKENPKTALAGSIVVGGVVIKKAKDKAGGLANKALETVDPNAFAYQKYGAQPIVRGKRIDNLEEEEEDNG